jgi:hypothetical protein
MATDNPKTVTIRGRLSFPRLTMAEAIAANPSSKFPKKDEDIAPEFSLLVEPAQLDKLKDHLLNVFLPYTEAQFAAGEKRDAFDPKQLKKVRDLIESGDWADQPPYIPIKVISEKSQDRAPECVASIKVSGNKGSDIAVKATVHSEAELAIPDPDLLTFPVIKPINETVHSVYPGAYFAVTLNLFAYVGNLPGVSASASTIVYRGDMKGDSFSGGTDIDEDDIFLDD